MRCYHLSNMYLSSIQNGVQSAHAQMELFIKYRTSTIKKKMLYDWAENHKTMIVLNGGYLSTMNEALDFITDTENPYPFASFHESEEALGGILTNIAIVLPEKIYKTAEFLRRGFIDVDHNILQVFDQKTVNEIKAILSEFGTFTKYEKDLCVFMNNFGLAS